jgi:hypothetical protein
MKTLWIAVAMAGLLVPGGSAGSAQTEMLAATPPMGWSTWNHFHHDISDALVRAQADALVSSGMRDAGYVYVNIDGGWEGSRDAAGVLHPTSNFPDMKALGDYIHSKGLKFGLYTGPGPKTCAGAMTEQTKSILMNREVIAVDQDPLGKEGDRAYATGPLEVWAKPLVGNTMAVALFNRLSGATRMTLRLKDVGWQGRAAARNLWTHEDVGVLSDVYTVTGHGVAMLRLSHLER